MPRYLSNVVLLLIAGCSDSHGGNVVGHSGPAPKNTGAASSPDVPLLKGEWRLTKIDGRPTKAAVLTFLFEHGKVQSSMGCSRRAWTFRQTRNIVAIAPASSQSVNCGKVPNQVQEAAFEALGRATIVIFDAAGREANLSGDGGNITLQRR